MEIYRAISEFEPPRRRDEGDQEVPQSENVLGFQKGDLFEVLESERDRSGRIWWGARALSNDSVGYIPAKYVKVIKYLILALHVLNLEPHRYCCLNHCFGSKSVLGTVH